jgi:heme/copper-type cytochrome/quinol oxidase subunit 2
MFNLFPKALAADESLKTASDSFANLNQTGFLAILNYWTGIFMWLVGILTFLVILYAAVLYMSAGANEENAKKAKKFLIWGMVGAVILVLSLSIVSFTRSFLV